MKRAKLLTLMAVASAASMFSSCEKNNTYKIGILLPVEHSALQSCTNGFIEGLVESGLKEGKDFKITTKNAGGNSADLSNFAKTLVSDSDMTFGLGTDAAKLLKSSSIDKGSVKPVLFSAVTDPVDAQLVESLENGKGFVTGSSDAQPVEDQIKLVKECIPSADKIGILYTQSETNSAVQAAQAETAATKEGLTTKTSTVTGAADINSTALALASESGIDAIYIPTDNNIAAHMNDVLQAANSKQVLLIVGEEGMLNNGGHITLSIDYKELGKITGKAAASIIRGDKKAYQIPVATMTKDDCKYVYSSTNIASSGISLPQDVIAKCTDVGK